MDDLIRKAIAVRNTYIEYQKKREDFIKFIQNNPDTIAELIYRKYIRDKIETAHKEI